jgi:hypothetical protein
MGSPLPEVHAHGEVVAAEAPDTVLVASAVTAWIEIVVPSVAQKTGGWLDH